MTMNMQSNSYDHFSHFVSPTHELSVSNLCWTVLVLQVEHSIHDYEHYLQQSHIPCRVISAQDLLDVINQSRSQSLDAVLIDLEACPNLNFLLSEQPPHPPVIVIGKNDAETAVRALKSGAADYLDKQTLTPTKLHQSLQQAIEPEFSGRDGTESKLDDFNTQIRTLVDNISQLAWMADPQGAIFWFNQRWFDYTGTTFDEMAGWGWQQVHHPDYVDRVVDKFRQCLETGQTWEDTFPLRGWDGEYRWFLSRAIPAYDAQGNILRWLGTNTDITELRQTEIALKQTTERLDTALRSAPLTLFNQDLDLRYTWIYNPSFSLPVEEIIGRRDADLMALDNVVRLTALKQQVIETGHGLREEVELTKNGQIVYFDLTIDPIYEQDKIVGITCAAVDITERKQTLAALTESESLKQQILDSSDDCIKVLSTEGQILYLNKGGMIVLEADDTNLLLNMDWVSFWQGESQVQARDAIAAAKKGNIGRFQGFCSTLKGTAKWWDVVVTPVQDSTNQVVKLVVISRDITKQKQAQATLSHSEQRYRSLIEATSQIIWDEQGNQGEFTTEQPGWSAFTGQVFAEYQGWGWLQAIHPDDQAKTTQVWLQSLEQQTLYEVEHRLRRHDGEYRYMNVRAVPVLTEEGTVREWIGVHTDITDRKQAEAALRQSEDRLRIALEAARLGTWDWNLVTHQLTWDARCKAMFGLPPDAETSIESFYAALHPDDCDRLAQVVQQALNPAVAASYDEEFRAIGITDGIERWIAAKGKAYWAPDGQPLRFVGSVLDITEQKQAQTQREHLLRQEQAAREAAERANQVKDEFLAVLSHELRSPLNPILGWAKLLQIRQFDAEKTAKALATIERNALLQTQLIDDLLDIAKILRGKLTLKVSPIDLAGVIAAATDTVRTAAEAKALVLQVDLPHVGQVSGDAARLQQIIWNLLSNAIKFTPEGGEVKIHLAEVNCYAQITVSDNGKGIPPSFLPHIFESFRQEDASTTRQYGGLGLGLAIVRQLVEAHGGTIRAESPGEGWGSTFTVRLPLINTQAVTQPQNSASPKLDLTGTRVLAVDDEADARELLAELLTQHGAEVLAVNSAADVEAALISFHPQVLVSDIGMPGVDGYSLIEQIRALPPESGGQTPAIALTAYARDDDQQRALASGYQQHVTKPLEPEQLVQAVMALVS